MFEVLAIICVVFVGCVFQASVGFGANVIAQPIVFLLDPSLVPGSVLLTVGLLNVMVIARERQPLQAGPIGWAGVGLLFGTGIGVATISAASDDGLAVVIAVSVLAMVGLMWSGRFDVPRSRRNIAIAGALGGFSGTTAGIGGPPMALLFNRAEGTEIRGFLASFFIVATSSALVGLHLAGRFGGSELVGGLRLFPVAIAAFALSGPLLPVVDRGYARPLILAASATAALVLLARTLL